MEFEVRLLGRFSVRRRGQEIPPASYEGRLVRTLLRVLASRPATFVSREFLVEALWPDRTPADPERNLNVMVARARRALEEPSLILTEPGGYSFDPENRCWIDSVEFARRVHAGRAYLSSNSPADALKEFSAALGLWRGEPLPEDSYQDWAQEYRTALFRLQQEALEGGAQASLAADDPAGAALLAEQAAAREPMKEAPHLILAEALYGAGDSAGALQVIASFKSRLADLLGLDPSKALDELEFMILNGALPRRFRPHLPPPRSIAFGSLPFVGRQVELDCILALLDEPGTAIATLEGSSGSGKSRLLEELKHNRPKPFAEAAAFLAEREEPWALARSLIREVLSLYPDAAASLPARTAEALAGVVPELVDLTPAIDTSTDPESRRALALEGALGLVRTAVAGGLPVLIDDLQWADPTSLLLLSQLGRRVPGIKMVLAYRPEELAPDGPVVRFLEAEESLRISLKPLSAEAIWQLVSDEDLHRVVVEQTDRSPLAVTELARSLAGSGAIALDESQRWASRNPALALIAGEQARIGQARAYVGRINRLAPPARQLMRTLALLGRPASARLLAAAISSTELETLEALEALSRAGLVRLGEMGWDTAHDLIAESVSEALEREEKARLHALLAEALRVEGADVWERARHLAQAGDDKAAAEAFVQAGKLSLDSFATEEAERSANAGLDLNPSPLIRSELLEIRAEARVRRGMLKEGRQDLRAALPAKRSGPERSRIISKLAILISGSEDYVQAAELAALAVTEAGDDPATRARALAVGAMVQGNLNHLEESVKMGIEALELYRSIEDAHGIADILELKALHTINTGHLKEGVEELGRVVVLFQDSGKLLRVGQPRTFRSLALFMLGRSEEALAEMDEVLELEQALGHAEGISLAHTGRSVALFGLGRFGEAQSAAELSVAAARTLEHKELTAIALFVLGLARSGLGDSRGAEQILEECIKESEGLPMFLSMAAARLSTMKAAQGRLDEAQAYLARARAEGPPVSQFEVRLAHAELAAALGDPAAADVAAEALEIARAEGYEISIPRLSELARSSA